MNEISIDESERMAATRGSYTPVWERGRLRPETGTPDTSRKNLKDLTDGGLQIDRFTHLEDETLIHFMSGQAYRALGMHAGHGQKDLRSKLLAEVAAKVWGSDPDGTTLYVGALSINPGQPIEPPLSDDDEDHASVIAAGIV